jgi:crotonobetainyl-CoA:carnitine CoA-transferase CaiB-like acyl-CoA transferase
VLFDPPPLPGQHTAEALTAWGIDDVQDLIAKKAAIQT